MVSDERVEVRDDADGIVHVVGGDILVDRDAHYTESAQGVAGASEETNRFEHALRDDRLHHVELQLTGFRGHGDGDVVTKDLETDLVDHFRNHRVDLCGHDRRASLAWRQVDLVVTGARAGGQQAEVIADLRELHGHALHGRVGRNIGATVAGGLDEIAGRKDFQLADLGKSSGHGFLVARRGVHTGADCGAAHVDLTQLSLRALQLEALLGNVVSECLELLTHGHWDCILQLGATHLQDLSEFPALGIKRALERVQVLDQLINGEVQTQTESGGVRVIGGLRHVHVVIGVDHVIGALGVTQVFQREVGDDLVGVHVGGSTSTALEHIDGELIHRDVVFQHLIAGPDDGIRLLLIQRADLRVGNGRGLLHHDQATNELRDLVDAGTRDLEVIHGSQRVHAVVGVHRNVHLTQKIFFLAEGGGLTGLNGVGLRVGDDVRGVDNVAGSGGFRLR